MPRKKAIVSKREFAAEISVGTRQVDRYIRTGKLDGAAVVKTGREVRINATIAKQQLRARLAPATSGRALTGGARLDDGDGAVNANGLTLNEELKVELLRGARHKNRIAALDAKARDGRYMLAADAVDLPKRVTEMMLRFVEGELPSLIVDIFVKEFDLPRAEVAALVDDYMRKVRRKAMGVGGRNRNGNQSNL